MSSGPILLTERELSERLNVPVRTLQAQRQRGGGFPYLKLGKSVRYHWTTVQARLSELERASTSQQPMPDDARHAQCRRCGAGIWWVRSHRGRWIPLEADGDSHAPRCRS